MKFIPGLYRHWKGGLYVAICTASTSEGDRADEEVIYFSVTMKRWWRRPLTMFQEPVPLERAKEYQEEAGGEVYKGPRFRLLARLEGGVLKNEPGVGQLGAVYSILGEAMASLGL